MPYEHLSRRERQAMVAMAKREARTRPLRMTEIPQERWPPVSERRGSTEPIKAWESSRYLAQLYPAAGCQRLSVCRVTLQKDGAWEANLSWDELMLVKRECGFGEYFAVEVYPKDRDIVNVANMRHLWLIEHLSIGWRASS